MTHLTLAGLAGLVLARAIAETGSAPSPSVPPEPVSQPRGAPSLPAKPAHRDGKPPPPPREALDVRPADEPWRGDGDAVILPLPERQPRNLR